MERLTLITKPSKDYELLDSGVEPARPDGSGHSGGEKLERYGDFLLARPDPQALWKKHLSEAQWQKAHGRYVRDGREGKWEIKKEVSKEWQIEFGGLKFIIRPTSFKHTGLFPEQLSNWEWVAWIIAKTKEVRRSVSQGDDPRSSEFSAENYATPENLLLLKPSILNLFGYTGGATLAAAQAGAEVCHVDASKTAVAWARENAAVSGLADKPIRWIVEDALVFVKREIQRGKRYDGVIMDPPAFGHGPKNELWKIEEDLIELVRLCGELLSPDPLFFLINGYAAGYSPLAFAYNLEFLTKKCGGSIEYGDLAIEESGGNAPDGAMMHRVLPCGIFARWQK